MTTRTQWVRNDADSQLNRSILQRLSFMRPRNVSQDGPPESDSGRYRFGTTTQTVRAFLNPSKESASKPEACAAVRMIRLRNYFWQPRPKAKKLLRSMTWSLVR